MLRHLSQNIIKPSIDLFRSPERFFREDVRAAHVVDTIIFVVAMGIASSFIQMFFYFNDPELAVGIGLAWLSTLLNATILMPFKIQFHSDLALLIAAFIYPLIFLVLCMVWSVIMHLIWKVLKGRSPWIESFGALAYCTAILPIAGLLLVAANVYNFMTDILYPSFFAFGLLAFLYFQNIIAGEIHHIPVRRVWISSLVLWPLIAGGVLSVVYYG